MDPKEFVILLGLVAYTDHFDEVIRMNPVKEHVRTDQALSRVGTVAWVGRTRHGEEAQSSAGVDDGIDERYGSAIPRYVTLDDQRAPGHRHPPAVR
ncbi:MAG TPA: hypothetical protein VFS20_27400 [Longimicrobium sp.]|nr:hypothetical protein [Longimicrobium sp.]